MAISFTASQPLLRAISLKGGAKWQSEGAPSSPYERRSSRRLQRAEGLGRCSPAPSAPDRKALPAAPAPPSPTQMPWDVPTRPQPTTLLLTFLRRSHRRGGRREQEPEREDLGARHTVRAPTRGARRTGVSREGARRERGAGSPRSGLECGDPRWEDGGELLRDRADGASSPKDCSLCARGGAEQTCGTWRLRLPGSARGCTPQSSSPRR